MPWPGATTRRVYDSMGRLRQATRLKGIKDFSARDYGLHPITLDTWGPFIFLHLSRGPPALNTQSPPRLEASATRRAVPDLIGIEGWLGASAHSCCCLWQAGGCRRPA